MGPVTPTKIASYGLCIAGLLLLLAGRMVEPLQGGYWAGIAVLVLGLFMRPATMRRMLSARGAQDWRVVAFIGPLLLYRVGAAT